MLVSFLLLLIPFPIIFLSKYSKLLYWGEVEPYYKRFEEIFVMLTEIQNCKTLERVSTADACCKNMFELLIKMSRGEKMLREIDLSVRSLLIESC